MPHDPRTGPRAGLRLMHVHAHPDDESSKGAASMARYVHEGVAVLVVSCTGGERGDILNPAMVERMAHVDDITEVRRTEMARAAEILGVQHRWLGFVDSGLPEGDPLPPLPEGSFAAISIDEAASELVRVVREFRPHVITTYDENGGYPHPDHVRTHEVSMVAFERAGDPAAFPGTGEPWQPLKLYYHLTFHKARLVALHEAAIASGMESPFGEWLEQWEDKPEDEGRLTTRVECGDWFEARDAALLAHETQVDPSGRWFSVPLDVQRQVWGTEDFQLARSLVPATVGLDGLEHDLFAGIRPAVGLDESA
ncbi:MAG TPA: mycothiol conjugate amidase Mca [Candidatus Nanopelagicales bacterium]|nr:mycothiol conjugate amidase Mca [Candidatus Nanopelagicales bacterium]